MKRRVRQRTMRNRERKIQREEIDGRRQRERHKERYRRRDRWGNCSLLLDIE